jgi:hypothetical protein
MLSHDEATLAPGRICTATHTVAAVAHCPASRGVHSISITLTATIPACAVYWWRQVAKIEGSN